MDVFVTAINLNEQIRSAIELAVRAGVGHGINSFSTGHRYIHTVIANIIRGCGGSVTIYVPSVDGITDDHINASGRIVVTDSNIVAHYKFVAENTGNLVAVSSGDPYVIYGRRAGKDIWYPLSGVVEHGIQKS